MKYILANKSDGKFHINYITTDPIYEVSKFEPIDVVNGELFTWDVDGNLFHFSSSSDVEATNVTSFLKPVNVGEWKAGEPIMTKVSEGHESDLRQALIDYLQSPSKKKLHLWLLNGKSTPQPLIKYSEMTLEELIRRAEERLKG